MNATRLCVSNVAESSQKQKLLALIIIFFGGMKRQTEFDLLFLRVQFSFFNLTVICGACERAFHSYTWL